MDVTEIDLDRLTSLELWELHERIAARIGPEWYDRYGDPHCPAERSDHSTVSARARMRSLV